MKKYLALLMAACLLFAGCSKEESAQNSLPAEDEVHDILAWGEVTYENSLEVVVAFPATVTELHVKTGDAVTLGQPLITLDMTDYEAQHAALTAESNGLVREVEQLRADLAEKTALYNSGSRPELQLLADAIARLEKEVADAETDAGNMRVLYEQGVVSKDDVELMEDVLAQKQKGKTDAENNLAKAQNDLRAELDGLEVQLAYKEGLLMEDRSAALVQWENQTAKDWFADGSIVCPMENAVVKGLYVSEGVMTGGQVVLSLIDADSLIVQAEVPEDYVGQITMDSQVEIEPMAGGSLTGHVVQIASMAHEKDGERIVIVKVKADDPEGILKAGYTADVYFLP